MPTTATTEAALHMWHAFSHAFRTPAGRPLTFGEGWIRLQTGDPHPFGNFLVAGEVGADELYGAVKPLAGGEFPAAVMLPAGVSPEACAALNELGFENVGPMPAMSVGTDNLTPTKLPDGYSFLQVGLDRGDEWTACASEGYGMPLAVADALSPKYVAADPDVSFYALEKDGRMEAVSLMVIHEGVAGLYSVATLTEARGKGLGAFITAQPLRLAGALGIRKGVLHASSMGYPVYKRLGFVDDGGVPFFLKS